MGSGKSKKKKKKKIPKNLTSCGVLVLRGDPVNSFLLMVHCDRLDLPKGHVDEGETNMECALRELEEETSIRESDIEIDPDFVFETTYEVRRKKYNHKPIPKTTYIYLARLVNDVKIELTEHEGHIWACWDPPHKIQENTINALLRQAEAFIAEKEKSNSVAPATAFVES